MSLPTTPLSNEEKQASLLQTAKELLAAQTADELWTAVAETARLLLTAERAAIFLYDEELTVATCPFAIGLSDGYINTICQQVESAPSQQLRRLPQPLIINDILTDARTAVLRDVMVAEQFTAYAAFPLMTPENDLLGTLIVYRNHAIPFAPGDISVGEMLAHMTAMTLNNLHLLAETRLNLRREQQLNEITQTLASAMDLPTILGHVIRMTAGIVGADAGMLGLMIDRQIMTFYPHNIPADIVLRPAPRGRGIAWEVVQSGETLHIENYPSYYQAQARWTAVGVTTLLATPITAAENAVGALILFNLHQTPKQFTSRQIALVESICHQTGIAIQHARMYAEAHQRTTALRHALVRQAELDTLKNSFIQTVSHELRTPLGIIHGHAELLTLGAMGELQPRQAESVGIIARRVNMLIDLVNDLTAMLAAETQELRRQEINLAALLYSILDEYRIQARHVSVTVKAEIQEDLPAIRGDITHLQRVFDNLFSNAFKFTPPDGLVTLRLWHEADRVFIEVADTGSGIPEENLGRIFERFYQVDGKTTRHHGGTGLGLALVKEIVEAHRGEVTVKSELGVGTTFRIMLPVAEGEAVRSKQ